VFVILLLGSICANRAYIVLYCIILYYIILCYIILYYIILYYIILYLLFISSLLYELSSLKLLFLSNI